MTEMPEKQPIVVDITRESKGNMPPGVQSLVDREKVEKLQAVAERLGGFSISVVAEGGDPYQTIFRTDTQRRVLSDVQDVPEGKVIVSIRNTAQPKTPADLSRLYDSLRNETEE